MKKDDFPEITPEEMPKFLNDVAEKFKDEEGQETMLKLAQCSFYIHLINSQKKDKNNAMVDVKKVIRDLVTIKTCCKNMKNEEKYDDIDREMYADWEFMIENTISLLEKQQTVVKE